MSKIVYMHGFSSGASSQKALRIKQSLCGHDVLVCNYPSHQPANSISMLTAIITEQSKGSNPIILIGSSLGGYYAQYLGSKLKIVKKVVLINPALQPRKTLRPYIGMHVNTVTGEWFQFLKSDYDELKLFDVPSSNEVADTLVLLDKADDVIDYRYAEMRYAEIGRVICYEGGSHWFDHLDLAIPEIVAFCK